MVADEPAIERAAAPVAARMGRRVADEYVAAIRNRLETNIDKKAEFLNRLPPDEATKVVRQEIEDAIGQQPAERIVVTNATRAVTIGQDSATIDSERHLGARIITYWVTERDGRVCPICRPLNGQPIDKWEEVMHGALVPSASREAVLSQLGPPAHPNCRCSRRDVIDAGFSAN